jgi:putative membrane protein
MRKQKNVWSGLAAGLIGGLVASWIMNQYQALWKELIEGGEENISSAQREDPQQRKESHRQRHSESDQSEEEPATEKIAEAISESVFDHKLTKRERQSAAPVVHYVFGATMGAFYGAVAEFAPAVTSGSGLLFGTTVWLGADETALPLLGLSTPPTDYPLSTHFYALTSHFVYGVSSEMVRRMARSAL